MTPEWRRNWLMALLVLVIGGGSAYGLLVGKPGPEPQAPPEIAPPRVDVVAVGKTRIITPEGTSWEEWFDGDSVTDDFMSEREQPEQQLREDF